jgi:CBS domain-containing protein
VRDITLLMIGGVSNLSEPPRSPRAEAVMALVGPLTSLALGVIFYAVDRLVAGFSSFEVKFGFFYLAEMNVFLGLFNLLPAFPMDGGRVVRALLVPRYGLIRATQIAAGLGKSFAIVFGIIGLFSFNIVLMIIAFFIFLGAEGESRGVLVKSMLGHFRVRDLMSPVRGSVSPKNSVYEAAERMLRDKCLAYPVIDNGRVAGIVTVGQVERVPPANRDRTLVEEVMRPAHVVSPDDDVSRALQAISEKDVGLLPVVQDGTPVGILQRSDVMRGLKLQELEVSQQQTGAWHRDSDRPVHVGA